MKRVAAAALSLAVGFAGAAFAQDKAPPMPKPGPITAPKGEYRLDLNHASLTWKVLHFGLSKYTARFTKFDATLSLDPARLANSAITVSIDPASVETDFPGDYKATHKDSPYGSFDEAIAQGPKVFNAGQFPTIEFKSTRVQPKGKDRLRVTGDLSFLGQTHPVTLDASVVGSIAEHPFKKHGAVGFSATGTLKRSEWGLTAMVPMIGDEVTIIFEGEFQQAVPAN